MLTRLGGRAAVAVDPVDLLQDCHGRIREFVAMARRIGEARDADPEAVREAARRVRRYFTEALPLHARDEEESVLPRLRGIDAALDRELAAMAREHREHEEPLGRLVAACRSLEDEPSRLEALRQAVTAPAAELEAHFAVHLAREETVIFPALRRLLAPADGAAVALEIRTRRTPPPAAAPAG